MTPPKNQFYLLKIFQVVLQQNQDSKLLMVGDGPDEKGLKEYAKELGINKTVKFLGNRNDVTELMQAMDLFLLPSRYEGLPVTLMEAQASGLPSVISDVITKEADITDLVTRESIESDPSLWAKEICEQKDCIREDTSAVIARAGFDMDRETKKLIKYISISINNRE